MASSVPRVPRFTASISSLPASRASRRTRAARPRSSRWSATRVEAARALLARADRCPPSGSPRRSCPRGSGSSTRPARGRARARRDGTPARRPRGDRVRRCRRRRGAQVLDEPAEEAAPYGPDGKRGSTVRRAVVIIAPPVSLDGTGRRRRRKTFSKLTRAARMRLAHTFRPARMFRDAPISAVRRIVCARRRATAGAGAGGAGRATAGRARGRGAQITRPGRITVASAPRRVRSPDHVNWMPAPRLRSPRAPTFRPSTRFRPSAHDRASGRRAGGRRRAGAGAGARGARSRDLAESTRRKARHGGALAQIT